MSQRKDCLLVAINAQYIHTNLAIRYFNQLLEESPYKAEVIEFTINQRTELLLRELAEKEAPLVVFSCYIWNLQMVCELGEQLRQVRPDVVLAVGGPQVSYHSEDFLQQNPAFDLVIRGEGERVLLPLLENLSNRDWQKVPGVVFNSGEELVVTPQARPVDMDELPFPYPDLSQVEGRILYYESSRGCPFRCSYCLSSVEPGVRFRSVELVKVDLRRFLAAGVRQVKFIDRTFNADLRRAMDIWAFLMEEDNGTTNFHFELEGRLLSDESIALLAHARPGLFQFEIGIQTTNPQTLREIRRDADIPGLFAKIEALRRPGNIHLHLDLIAGLPYEDYQSFGRSFDAVYALRPHQFQLGFLKVLGGSEMERKAGAYDALYRKSSPFQILSNRWISYKELVCLSDAEDMVETYYNSGRFDHILGWMVEQYPSPFVFYQALGDYFSARGYHLRPHSKEGYYEILWAFMAFAGLPQTEQVKWLCKFDILLHEKPKKLPAFVDVDLSFAHRGQLIEFWKSPENRAAFLPNHMEDEPKQILRMAHAECFPFDPQTGQPGQCWLLFDYSSRDVTGKALVQPLDLSF
ncbi:B12-binding domain-containing radical SAM protein [Oscillospiraceae bacterium MB08-C2-2]|nr:B12-binding domain-containing radical SAM protein [Oscillospiraceae bacterium MB08-C2-2]